MLDLSKPIQTRDGKPARILANDVKGDTENKIIALVDTGDEEILAIRLADGRLLEDEERPDDLVNAIVRETVYVSLGETFGSAGAASLGDDWPVLKVEVEHYGNLKFPTRVVRAELA